MSEIFSMIPKLAGRPSAPMGRCTFAYRRVDRIWVGVHEVRNGLACDCICPECGSALVAKQGSLRSAYFSHAAGTSACGMGWWHAVIRDSIAELHQIDFGSAAPVPRMRGSHRILSASREEPVLGGEFRLDVEIWLQSGFKLAVEVVDKSEIAGIKFLALEQESFRVLRIDTWAIRKAMDRRPATGENLRALLSSCGGWQSWPQLHEEPIQEPLQFLPPSWAELIRNGLRSCMLRRCASRNAWTNFEDAKGKHR